MRLIKFLLSKRLAYFISTKNWANLFIEIYYLLLLLLLAYGCSRVYNDDSNQNDSIHPVLGLILFGTVVFSLPILTKFFPSFRHKRNYLDNHFPLKKKQVVFIDLIIFGLCKMLNISILLSIITFCLLSINISGNEFLLLMLLLLFGFLLSEAIVSAISWNKKLFGFTLLLIGVVVSFYFLYADFFKIWIINLLFSILIISVFILYYQFYDTKKREDRKYKTIKISEKSNTSHMLKILKHNKLYATTFVVALIIKMMFLTLYFMTARIVNVNGFPDNILIFSFITPLLIFGYIYNNSWGFCKPIVINAIITGNSIGGYFKLYTRLVTPALIVDFLTSFFTINIFKYSNLHIWATYFVFSFFYFSLGFLSSFIRYININSEISFKTLRTNTSQLISFFDILPTVVLFFCFKNNFSLLLLQLSLLGLSGIILFFVFKYPKYVMAIPRSKIF